MFFSGKGDDGTTGWLGEGRLPKYDLRIETLGAVDESTAALGLARSLMGDTPEGRLVLQVQRNLYHLMAELAAAPENAEKFRKIEDETVKELEEHIERLEKEVRSPGEFIVSGDSQAGAAMALSRTIVRRAERRVVELYDRGMITNPYLSAYLNRLSSLCFVLELVLTQTGKSKLRLAKGTDL